MTRKTSAFCISFFLRENINDHFYPLPPFVFLCLGGEKGEFFEVISRFDVWRKSKCFSGGITDKTNREIRLLVLFHVEYLRS